MRTGSFIAFLVNLVVLLNFLVAYLHTTRTHRVYVLGSRKLPEAEANFTLPDPSAVSFYQQWIQTDLQPWREHGITTVSMLSLDASPRSMHAEAKQLVLIPSLKHAGTSGQLCALRTVA